MHVDPDSRMFLSLEINIIRQIRFSFKRQKEKQRVCTSHISKKITFFFVFLFLKSLSPSKPCEPCFCCYVVLAMCVSIHLLMKCVCVCVLVCFSVWQPRRLIMAIQYVVSLWVSVARRSVFFFKYLVRSFFFQKKSQQSWSEEDLLRFLFFFELWGI